MKPKNILVFGASGQIGRNLLRKLTKKNYRVTAITRNIHQKGYVLKTQGNPGYIDVIEANVFDATSINNLVSKCDVCVNLVGILFEKKKIHFKIFIAISLSCYQIYVLKITLNNSFIFQG